MPIRPIDMQVLLPKVSRLDQNKPAVVHRDQNELQMAQNEQAKQTALMQNRVAHTDKSEATSLKRQKEKEQKEKKKKDQQESEDPNKGKHLDIKV